ncbi:MAG: hypothetical protein JWN66_4401 [Sphingomonas bacterium]|nr:hypothetical protein [Sphingomonas bacterium]
MQVHRPHVLGQARTGVAQRDVVRSVVGGLADDDGFALGRGRKQGLKRLHRVVDRMIHLDPGIHRLDELGGLRVVRFETAEGSSNTFLDLCQHGLGFPTGCRRKDDPHGLRSWATILAVQIADIGGKLAESRHAASAPHREYVRVRPLQAAHHEAEQFLLVQLQHLHATSENISGAWRFDISQLLGPVDGAGRGSKSAHRRSWREWDLEDVGRVIT